MKRLAPVLCVLAVVATKIYWSSSRDRAAEANPAPRLHLPSAAPSTPSSMPAGSSSPPPSGLGPAPASPTLRRLADAAARARVMEAISAARARRTAAPAAPIATPAPAPATDDPPMSMADVQTSFKAVVPLLADCYERALPQLAVKSGSIAVHMHATGEPDVGTLIDDATLTGGGGLLDDQELGQCLHETLLSVELPPMPEGGVVEITYPITFQESGD